MRPEAIRRRKSARQSVRRHGCPGFAPHSPAYQVSASACLPPRPYRTVNAAVFLPADSLERSRPGPSLDPAALPGPARGGMGANFPSPAVDIAAADRASPYSGAGAALSAPVHRATVVVKYGGHAMGEEHLANSSAATSPC